MPNAFCAGMAHRTATTVPPPACTADPCTAAQALDFNLTRPAPGHVRLTVPGLAASRVTYVTCDGSAVSPRDGYGQPLAGSGAKLYMADLDNLLIQAQGG